MVSPWIENTAIVKKETSPLPSDFKFVNSGSSERHYINLNVHRTALHCTIHRQFTMKLLSKALILVTVATTTCSAAPSKFDCSRTKKVIDGMQKMYDYGKGTWQGGSPPPSTWNDANALTALCDYMKEDTFAAGQYSSVLDNTFLKVQQDNLKDNNTAQSQLKQHPTPALPEGFINEFYDDIGWWALGWIRAYEVTNKDQFLKAAEQIFERMASAWEDSKCNGGVWWTTEKSYKNAITNELFLSLAAQLANTIPDKKDYYVKWAKRELDWFKGTGMINGDNIVNDGLDMNTCKNNKQTVWTYNQGVILGGLVALDKANPNKEYIDLATKIADAAIKKMAPGNILKEECEPNCGGGSTFKGVFIRNLIDLYKKTNKNEYKTVILTSASSLWDKGRYENNNTFGDAWGGPKSDITIMSESSASDLFVAAYKASDC